MPCSWAPTPSSSRVDACRRTTTAAMNSMPEHRRISTSSRKPRPAAPPPAPAAPPRPERPAPTAVAGADLAGAGPAVRHHGHAPPPQGQTRRRAPSEELRHAATALSPWRPGQMRRPVPAPLRKEAKRPAAADASRALPGRVLSITIQITSAQRRTRELNSENLGIIFKLSFSFSEEIKIICRLNYHFEILVIHRT